MYYFGDADNEGVAFNGGFNKENLSYGGSLIFAYLMPVGNHSNLRFSMMGGKLNGNNKVKFDNLALPRDDYRKFSSYIIQPAVGVECYPFSSAGFFLYGGIALTASIIDNYEFYYYKSVPSGKERRLVQGKTFGFLPMIQLGLGYNWKISRSWSLGVEVMIQEGVTPLHSAEELYSTCDIISLHIPATPQTKGSINAALLSRMPNNAVLVNTARKEVINEEELIQFMQERKAFAYVTDVMPAADQKLNELFEGRYFSTPKKMGAQTAEANINAGIAAAKQIVDFFENGVTKFQVNK